MDNNLHNISLCPFKFDKNGFPTTSKSLDLPDGIVALNIETVEKATDFDQLKPPPHKYHLQNIVWSGDKIINSCDE